jgi:hypothetical protein
MGFFLTPCALEEYFRHLSCPRDAGQPLSHKRRVKGRLHLRFLHPFLCPFTRLQLLRYIC